METTVTKMNRYGKEEAGTGERFECGICFYQSRAKDFTPITVSANFAALECPKCLNNDTDSFNEVTTAVKQAA